MELLPRQRHRQLRVVGPHRRLQLRRSVLGLVLFQALQLHRAVERPRPLPSLGFLNLEANFVAVRDARR